MRVCPLQRFGEHLLENWNSSTTAPDALFSPWWASTASSDRLCCSLVVLPLRCCFECLHSPRVPTLGKSPFSPHEGFWCRRSTALSSSWVSNLGESTVKETNRSFDRSRSKFADPRYRPRRRITKSVTVTTAYNRTILSGTADSAQYKMAKAALHLKCFLATDRYIWWFASFPMQWTPKLPFAPTTLVNTTLLVCA